MGMEMDNKALRNTIIIDAKGSAGLLDEPDKSLDKAAKCLRNGGLVAFPTETVYGLGADGLNPEASKKIYAAKGRPSDNPLIVHIADMEALEKLAYTNEKAYTLAHAFWPGPLTIILPKRDVVPKETTGGLDTVAIRMPSHPAALELIRLSGVYVAAPSANISGRPSPTTAAHVIEDMSGRIDYIIDGGPVGIGIESTIVDLSGEVPAILRPGFITKRMLEDMIGEVVIDPAIADPKESVLKGLKPKAPGMKYTHYAPKGELTLVEKGSDNVTGGEPVIDKIRELAKEKMESGYKVGIMAPQETVSLYEGYADYVVCVGERKEQATIAAGLYSALRSFDDAGAEYIYAESFRGEGLSYAIMNRLLKAAGQRVIYV
jgi:L-threonylcarbamoyladenylate synthase